MVSGKDRKRPKQARSKATVDAIVEGGGLARAVALSAAYLRSQPALTGDRDPELLALVIFHALRGALNSVVAHAPEKLDDADLPEILAGGVLGFLGQG